MTARSVIYLLIGWVAVLVALGHSSREADQQGALQLLAGKPYGLVSLWQLGIGFVGYALWRLREGVGVWRHRQGAAHTAQPAVLRVPDDAGRSRPGRLRHLRPVRGPLAQGLRGS